MSQNTPPTTQKPVHPSMARPAQTSAAVTRGARRPQQQQPSRSETDPQALRQSAAPHPTEDLWHLGLQQPPLEAWAYHLVTTV